MGGHSMVERFPALQMNMVILTSLPPKVLFGNWVLNTVSLIIMTMKYFIYRKKPMVT